MQNKFGDHVIIISDIIILVIIFFKSSFVIVFNRNVLVSFYDNDVTTLQSIFVFCFFTDWFYNLPCEYNFQLDESMWQKGLEAIFPAYHNCTKMPKIYHGNGGTDIPQEDENGQLRLWKQKSFFLEIFFRSKTKDIWKRKNKEKKGMQENPS